MKTNLLICSPQPSVKKQQQTSAGSPSKFEDESLIQKCPYCVKCENGKISQNSSPTIIAKTTATNQDSLYPCSSSECESLSTVEGKDVSSLGQSSYVKFPITQPQSPPSSLSKLALTNEKLKALRPFEKYVTSTGPVCNNSQKEEVDANCQNSQFNGKKLNTRWMKTASADTENSGSVTRNTAVDSGPVCGNLCRQRLRSGNSVEERPTVASKCPNTQQLSESKKKTSAQPSTTTNKRFEHPVPNKLKSLQPSKQSENEQFTAPPMNLAPRPVFHPSSRPGEWRKPVCRRPKSKKATIDTEGEALQRNAQMSVNVKEVATTMSKMESLSTSGMRTTPTKVEYSKLQTDNLETPATVATTETRSSATGKRPMSRCLDLPTSSLMSAQQPPQQLQENHVLDTSASKKKTVSSKQRVPASQLASGSKNVRVSIAQKSTQPRSSIRQTRLQPSGRSVSVEDVGVDGGKAYIIRQERREKVNWRRGPRYRVKQTTTSRLRYGYWFADCGRQRVKAFRGDWSHIPEEMLRDWEVYQNYFRYRLKSKERKRTSSLVRKFIAGKYREVGRTASFAKKRPIRKMSPLVRADQSSMLSPNLAGPLYDGDNTVTAPTTGDIQTRPQFAAEGLKRGSNVSALLRRRAQSQLRDRQRAQQRLAHLTRLESGRKPHIKVHSTFTSRLRKQSMIEPCGKPLTPTLWHGSAGEMVELKQKIALRRQRLKENWLQQTAALRADVLSVANANIERDDLKDKSAAEYMARMIVVGASVAAPLANGAGSSFHCKSFRGDHAGRGAPISAFTKSTTMISTNKSEAKKMKDSKVNALVPHIAPEAGCAANLPCVTSFTADVMTGAWANGFVSAPQPMSSSIVSKSPKLLTEPPLPSSLSALQTRGPSKRNTSFRVFRKLLSVAKWLIPPTIPIQQNLTSTLRRRRLNGKT